MAGEWAELIIGQRGDVYRVYGYIWHSEQDASREHKVRDMAARGGSPEAAIALFRERTSRQEWAGVAALLDEMLDEVADVAA